MRWTIKVVFEAVPGRPVEHEVGIIERAEEISPAIVGLTIAEGKALLASLQEQIVTAQIQQHVTNIKPCPRCGKAFRTKGYYHSTLRSVYGSVDMRIRRLCACPCSGSIAQSFSTLFTNKRPITPELRYLTAKMTALLPFRKAADFLGELLPLSAQATASIQCASQTSPSSRRSGWLVPPIRRRYSLLLDHHAPLLSCSGMSRPRRRAWRLMSRKNTGTRIRT